MRVHSASLLLAAFLSAAWALDARAQTVSLNPVADAFVAENEPNSNFGGGGAMGVSAPKFPNGELQALLRFDLASAKSSFDATFGAGNWTLDSAVLQLAAGAANNSIFNTPAAGQLQVTWLQNDSWVEGSGTPSSPGTTGIMWSTLPSFLSAGDQNLGAFAFDGSTTSIVMHNLALSSGFTGDVASGGLASMRLGAASGDAAVAGVFSSRSFGTPARRPLLTLSAVPEPAGWALAACAGGIVAMVALGNRLRNKRGALALQRARRE